MIDEVICNDEFVAGRNIGSRVEGKSWAQTVDMTKSSLSTTVSFILSLCLSGLNSL